MTKKELNLIDKILEQDTLYFIEDNDIHLMNEVSIFKSPFNNEITLRGWDCNNRFGETRDLLLSDYLKTWAFDQESVRKCIVDFRISQIKKQIEKLQKEMDNLEELRNEENI